jgi:hypothetical protein
MKNEAALALRAPCVVNRRVAVKISFFGRGFPGESCPLLRGVAVSISRFL